MADYVEAFDIDVPADDDDVEQGDDNMRQMKRAIVERLETFFKDFNANPLVAIAASKIFTGLIELNAVQSTIMAAHFKEYDVDVIGAKIGDLAHAEWEADDVYPTDADTPPDTSGGTGINGRDYVNIKAWCLNDDKVRIRMINPSGVGVGGVDGLKVRAWAVQTA